MHHARLVPRSLDGRAATCEYAQGVKGPPARVGQRHRDGCEFLPPVLQTYLRDHPDVNIDLRERLSFDVVRAVGEGKIVPGIVSGFERTEALQVIPYRRDRLSLRRAAGAAELAQAARRSRLPTRWPSTTSVCRRQRAACVPAAHLRGIAPHAATASRSAALRRLPDGRRPAWASRGAELRAAYAQAMAVSIVPL